MNSSLIFDSPNEIRTKRYESAVNRPVYSQGFQPVLFSEKDYSCKEVPIYYQDEQEVRVTVGSILSMLLIQLIPFLGIFMAVKWSLTKDNNYVRRTVSRALLVFYAVLAVVISLGYLVAGATL